MLEAINNTTVTKAISNSNGNKAERLRKRQDKLKEKFPLMKQTDDSKKSGEIKKNYSQINDNLYYTPTKAREKNSPETQKKINELRNKMDELNDEIAKLKSKDIERYDHISELTIDGMTKHESIDTNIYNINSHLKQNIK